jgi:hypothetical protein
MALTAKVKKTINNGLRFIIALLALWFIYRQVSDPANLQAFTDSLSGRLDSNNFIALIIIAVLLMTINWGIEAYKWQLLINYAERVSFKQALMSVLSGITMSLFTPNRIGDFLGRLLTLKHANPLKGAFLTIVGSISQLLTTLLMGMFALCFYIPYYHDIENEIHLGGYILIVFLLIVTAVVMVSMFLRVSRVAGLTRAFIRPGWQKVRGYLRIMRRLRRKLLLKVLMLSALRYMIFSTQFYILLLAFGFSIPWFHAFILISMTYFTMTAIPTIALVDLGIRGSVAIYFLGLYAVGSESATLAILAATTSVWVVNLALPAVGGMLFIYRLKLIRKV